MNCELHHSSVTESRSGRLVICINTSSTDSALQGWLPVFHLPKCALIKLQQSPNQEHRNTQHGSRATPQQEPCAIACDQRIAFYMRSEPGLCSGEQGGGVQISNGFFIIVIIFISLTAEEGSGVLRESPPWWCSLLCWSCCFLDVGGWYGCCTLLCCEVQLCSCALQWLTSYCCAVSCLF